MPGPRESGWYCWRQLGSKIIVKWNHYACDKWEKKKIDSAALGVDQTHLICFLTWNPLHLSLNSLLPLLAHCPLFAHDLLLAHWLQSQAEGIEAQRTPGSFSPPPAPSPPPLLTSCVPLCPSPTFSKPLVLVCFPGPFPSKIHRSGLPRGFSGEESICNAGDVGSAPGWGRPPGGGHRSSL